MKIIYATTNLDKFNRAKINLAITGLNLIHRPLTLNELQSKNGQEIVAHKAHQAFEQLQQPVLVSDDTWEIPALNGFPGTSMKQCNHYLVAQDWLRLMQGLTNRTAIMLSHLAYYDGENLKIFTNREEAYFLLKAQGKHPLAPHLEVIAWEGEIQSVAEKIKNGIRPNQAKLWKKIASHIKAHS